MQRLSCLLLLLGAMEASASQVTPVQKVIQMMSKMVEKGEAEMEAEQKQFKEYVKFCENVTVEKGRRIEEGNAKIESLTASIEKAAADIDELQTNIKHENEIIDRNTEELDNATALRKSQRTDYEATLKDYEDSIAAMARAMKVLKGAAKSREQVSLLQLQLSSAFQSKQQLSAAEASQYLKNFLRGIDDSEPASAHADQQDAFLEESADPVIAAPQGNGYERHSSGVLDLMYKLQHQFMEEKNVLQSEELQRQNAYQGVKVGLDAEINDATTDKERDTSEKNSIAQDKASNEADLAETKDVLAADTKYKKDLEADWAKQDADYTARQKLRGEELEVLNKAIEIINGSSVSGSADKHLPSLLQVPDEAVALAQMASKNLRGHSAQRVAELLQRQAQLLQSKSLAALALRIQAGPIDKIKSMIKDMVSNLETKLAEEATKEAWCQEELSKNKQTRSDLSDEVEGLQSKIDKLNSTIETLTREVSDLSAQIVETKTAMQESTELRQKEHANNTATIADAKAAQAAVEQAMKVLQDFYEKAGKATALLEVENAEDPYPAAPKALSGGSYQGMGAETGGVLGLIEVIKSDFARLEAETTTEEDTAAKEYETFMEDSKLDLVAKDKDVQYKTADKESKQRKMASKNMDLEGVQEELDAALKTFEKLKPECSTPHPTFEERKAARDKEIKALEGALESLKSATNPAEGF